MKLDAGELLAGRYKIIEEIGRGGMSIVYRALDIKLGRDVSFKVLREEYISDTDFLERFRTEARAVATLSHPNIVNVYDVGVDSDVNYIVMEFIDGVTLKELIRRSAPFVDESILGVSVQIAQALVHAHKNNVIHRDIKPQNILITRNGDVKVTDFGIARMTTEETIVASDSRKTMGSVQYLSPEQARGDVVDEKSDLYALGIVMFEMSTGTLPFTGETPVSVAYKHVNEELPSIASLNPHINPILVKIIEKLTRKEPFGRYHTANELIKDVKVLLNRLKSGTKRDYQQSISYTMDISDLPDEWVDHEREISPRRAKPERVAIIAGLSLALFLGILAMFFMLPKIFKGSDTVEYVDLPVFIGLNYEEATKIAGELDLQIEKLEDVYSDVIPEGKIAATTMDTKTQVKKNEIIGLYVSLGQNEYEVPDLTKVEEKVAREIITNLMNEKQMIIDLIVKEENSEDYPRGVIIAQTPDAGTMNTSDKNITIIVSKGPEILKVTVPGLLGLTEDRAKSLIKDNSLQVGNIYTEHSDRYKEGLVIAQTVDAGSEVNENTVIAITISLGAEEVATETPVDTETETETPIETATTVKKKLPIDPIVDPNKSYQIKVAKEVDGRFVEVYQGIHQASDFPLEIEVEGQGVVTYVLYVEGVFRGEQTVDFDN